jgi:hypothetical protein
LFGEIGFPDHVENTRARGLVATLSRQRVMI